MNYVDLFDMMEKLENEEEDQTMIVESITKCLKNIYIMNKKIEQNKEVILFNFFIHYVYIFET